MYGFAPFSCCLCGFRNSIQNLFVIPAFGVFDNGYGQEQGEREVDKQEEKTGISYGGHDAVR